MANLQSTTINGSSVLTYDTYPPLLGTYFFNGDYTADTWYTVFILNSLGYNGPMMLTGFADTYSMGGQIYESIVTSPVVLPCTTRGPNDGEVFPFRDAIFSGHAPNTERWQFRIVHTSRSTGQVRLQWQSNRSYTNADWNAGRGRKAKIELWRLL